MRPLHICLVTHHYSPEANAPQRRWRALIRRFIAAGHQVSVLAPPPHYPGGTLQPGTRPEDLSGGNGIGEWGESIYRVAFREHGPGLASRSIDQAVAASDSVRRGLEAFRLPRNRPDVFIATAPGLPSIPAAAALGRLLHRPTVVEMRDAWPDLISPSGMLGPDAHHRRPAQSVVALAHRSITRLQRRTAAVVTTTQAFAQVLRERGVKHVHVIRNGSTVELLPTLEPPTQHRGLRVLYAGTLGRSQGLEYAIAAARIAQQRGLDISVRIAGSGAEEPELREIARSTGAPVEFLGRVPYAEIPAHYTWADTALVSLRSWEPFEWTIPSKLYEMLAVRRYISGMVAGEAAHIISEAHGGFVVPPESPVALADAWVDLAAHRERLDVGPDGREWVVRNAHHDLLAARYLEILGGIVER